ncbi:hypothetical protein HK405_008348 [Cladochytrium tenue]|nr:hypothetical protein HK405_008348 [Cladochytrium tenue]
MLDVQPQDSSTAGCNAQVEDTPIVHKSPTQHTDNPAVDRGFAATGPPDLEESVADVRDAPVASLSRNTLTIILCDASDIEKERRAITKNVLKTLEESDDEIESVDQMEQSARQVTGSINKMESRVRQSSEESDELTPLEDLGAIIPLPSTVPFAMKPIQEAIIDSRVEERRCLNRALIQAVSAVTSWEILTVGDLVKIQTGESPDDQSDQTETYREILSLRWGTEIIRANDFVHVALPTPKRPDVRMMMKGPLSPLRAKFGEGSPNSFGDASSRTAVASQALSPFEESSEKIADYYSRPQPCRLLRITRMLRHGREEAAADGAAPERHKHHLPRIVVEGAVYTCLGAADLAAAAAGAETSSPSPSSGADPTPRQPDAFAGLRFEGFGRFDAFRVLVGRRHGTRPGLRISRKSLPGHGSLAHKTNGVTVAALSPQPATVAVPSVGGSAGAFGFVGTVGRELGGLWTGWLPRATAAGVHGGITDPPDESDSNFLEVATVLECLFQQEEEALVD